MKAIYLQKSYTFQYTLIYMINKLLTYLLLTTDSICNFLNIPILVWDEAYFKNEGEHDLPDKCIFSWWLILGLFIVRAAALTINKLIIFLLHLEAIIIRILLFFIILTNFLNNNFVHIAIVLTIRVRRASLGLACLVKIVRTYGNDNIKSLRLK